MRHLENALVIGGAVYGEDYGRTRRIVDVTHVVRKPQEDLTTPVDAFMVGEAVAKLLESLEGYGANPTDVINWLRGHFAGRDTCADVAHQQEDKGS